MSGPTSHKGKGDVYKTRMAYAKHVAFVGFKYHFMHRHSLESSNECSSLTLTVCLTTGPFPAARMPQTGSMNPQDLCLFYNPRDHGCPLSIPCTDFNPDDADSSILRRPLERLLMQSWQSLSLFVCVQCAKMSVRNGIQSYLMQGRYV